MSHRKTAKVVKEWNEIKGEWILTWGGKSILKPTLTKAMGNIKDPEAYPIKLDKKLGLIIGFENDVERTIVVLAGTKKSSSPATIKRFLMDVKDYYATLSALGGDEYDKEKFIGSYLSSTLSLMEASDKVMVNCTGRCTNGIRRQRDGGGPCPLCNQTGKLDHPKYRGHKIQWDLYDRAQDQVLFNRIDTDQDASISREEFIAAFDETKRTIVEAIFNEIDGDHSGSLDIHECFTGVIRQKLRNEGLHVLRRRRMAQREFSSRRDSPVMVRLLKEIIAAQDK